MFKFLFNLFRKKPTTPDFQIYPANNIDVSYVVELIKPYGLSISKEGKEFIKSWEGLKLKSYQCSAGKWTIGWGTTSIAGKPVTKNMTITEEEANAYFEEDAEEFQEKLRSIVKVDLNQNQWDALVSFVYNIGIGSFKKSSFLKLLNANLPEKAAEEFHKWVYVTAPITKKKEKLAGLINRRKSEFELFTK